MGTAYDFASESANLQTVRCIINLETKSSASESDQKRPKSSNLPFLAITCPLCVKTSKFHSVSHKSAQNTNKYNWNISQICTLSNSPTLITCLSSSITKICQLINIQSLFTQIPHPSMIQHTKEHNKLNITSNPQFSKQQTIDSNGSYPHKTQGLTIYRIFMQMNSR